MRSMPAALLRSDDEVPSRGKPPRECCKDSESCAGTPFSSASKKAGQIQSPCLDRQRRAARMERIRNYIHKRNHVHHDHQQSSTDNLEIDRMFDRTDLRKDKLGDEVEKRNTFEKSMSGGMKSDTNQSAATNHNKSDTDASKFSLKFRHGLQHRARTLQRIRNYANAEATSLTKVSPDSYSNSKQSTTYDRGTPEEVNSTLSNKVEDVKKTISVIEKKTSDNKNRGGLGPMLRAPSKQSQKFAPKQPENDATKNERIEPYKRGPMKENDATSECESDGLGCMTRARSKRCQSLSPLSCRTTMDFDHDMAQFSDRWLDGPLLAPSSSTEDLIKNDSIYPHPDSDEILESALQEDEGEEDTTSSEGGDDSEASPTDYFLRAMELHHSPLPVLLEEDSFEVECVIQPTIEERPKPLFPFDEEGMH